MEYQGRELEVLSRLDNYHDWIVEEFGGAIGGDVLEVGAGAGAISRRLTALAATLTLIEPCPSLSAQLGPTLGVPVVPESLEQFLAHESGRRFDTIVSVNVLEHIEDDVAALCGLRSHLRDDGALCLFVPALPWLYSSFDRTVGHHRRYTRRSLASALSNAGFVTERLDYFDAPGALAWAIVCRVLGRTDFQAGPVDLYDRWIVPVTRGIESRLRPSIGKNIIAVARPG